MPFKIVGSTSNNVVEVDSNNNLKTNLPTVKTQAGFASLLSENDDGTRTGTRSLKAPQTTENNRLRVGEDAILFKDYITGASSYPVYLWNRQAGSMSQSNANGFTIINSGNSVTATQYWANMTYRYFSVTPTQSLLLEMGVAFTVAPQVNNLCEWGFNYQSGTTTPVDGVYFRLDAAGALRCVVTNNSVDTTSAALTLSTYVTTGDMARYAIRVDANQATFWINDQLVATVARSNTNAMLTASGSWPVSYRNYNPGTPALAQQLKFSYTVVSQIDGGNSKPWSHILAGAGNMIAQNPGNVMAVGITNSQPAGAGAALSNTAAAAGTGLGGQFAVQPTLAQGTDGILCSYFNNGGAGTGTGRTLYITGVRIQGAVTTALTGGPVVYQYTLCYGHNALSLANGDGGGSKQPRKTCLGFESYAVTAAVGAIGQGVSMQFVSPIVVNNGEYLAIAAKNVGVVTSTGVILMNVAFDGYWE